WAFSNPVKRTGAALARMVPRSELTRRAKAGLMRSNKRGRRVAGIYSVTSSAREVGREDREPGEISLGSLHIENELLTLNIADTHHAGRRRGSRVAGRGARTAGDAGCRVSSDRCGRCNGAHGGSPSPWTKRSWLCRGPECRYRVSLWGWSIRSTAV